MRLTFLGPPDQAQVANRAEFLDRCGWEREYACLSEPIERPFKSRISQIAVGVGFQFMIMQLGMWIIIYTHCDLITEITSLAAPLYVVALILGLFVLAALVGGGAAGAWCINWGLQGIGVGLGFLATVVFRILLFLPPQVFSKLEIPPLALAIIAGGCTVTLGLTTIGALFGNLLIRPVRVPLDAIR